jgi:hypothetical protein
MTQLSKQWLWIGACLLASLLAVGCGGGGSSNSIAADSKSGGVDKEMYLVKTEPAGAKSVREARENVKDGDEVAIVGHIGGGSNPWVEGRAAFWIVDSSIKPCPPGEGCKTPWDCCCVPKEDLLKAMATIKIIDDQGQTVPMDARKLLGVKESMTVVAHGRAKRDDKGNLTVLTDNLFVRE